MQFSCVHTDVVSEKCNSISVDPVPCLDGCFCYYSVKDGANTVDYSNSNMSHLPHQVLPQTQQLIMATEQFQTLDKIDDNLLQIKNFSFQGSNLRHVSDKAWKSLISTADSVNFPGNKLTHVPTFLQTETYQTYLWLSFNPFKCSCDMMWMRDWLLNTTNVKKKEKENITCGAGKWKGMVLKSGSSKFLVVSFFYN